MIFDKQTNKKQKKEIQTSESYSDSFKNKRTVLGDITNSSKKSKLNCKKSKLYPKTYRKYLDPLILSYKDSVGASRIPRCSTGFDNKIPGYFNTNFGQILLNISELYSRYDVELFEYFDFELLDIPNIKKRENNRYLDLYETKD